MKNILRNKTRAQISQMSKRHSHVEWGRFSSFYFKYSILPITTLASKFHQKKIDIIHFWYQHFSFPNPYIDKPLWQGERSFRLISISKTIIRWTRTLEGHFHHRKGCFTRFERRIVLSPLSGGREIYVQKCRPSFPRSEESKLWTLKTTETDSFKVKMTFHDLT